MKLMSILSLAIVMGVSACNTTTTSSTESTEQETNKVATVEVKSPVGTYSTTENDKPMQFVLNADSTGYENYQGTETRPFTWKMKAGKVFFTYNGETMQWQLPIDIEKGEITYGALVYKKE